MKHITLSFLLIALTIQPFAQVKVDRSKAPGPGPAPAIQIGNYTTSTLPNGLKIIVVENHKLPRISWSIQLDIDPVFEGTKAGYVGMAGDLLGAGTNNLTKAQIDEKIDFLGASMSTSSKGIFASSLTKHTDDLLTLMSDVLLNPAFPESEIEKLRKQSISGLASEKTDPNAISDKIGNLVKFGKNHPYGEFTTEASLSSITRDDLLGYYATHFRPKVAYLVVVGDITPERAFESAKKYFGDWADGPVSPHKFPVPKAPQGNVVAFVPVPGAVQSVIDVTYPIDLRPGTMDAIHASVLNNILGGSGFQTRLMQNLREDKAYTYGAYSSISPDDVAGSFSAGASVRNEVTDSSIVQILFEMNRLVNEAVDEATLQTVKNIMTGSFARSLERPQTVANFALNIEKYKLPKDYYETYLQKLNAVTVADVQNAAKKFLRPENAYITVVGNKDIAPTLRSFSASGNIDMYQPDGSVFVELKPAPSGVTTAIVLQKYIDAIGGEKNIKKVKSYESKGKMELGEMAMEMNMQVKTGKPGKMAMTVNVMGMEAMKQVYNGSELAMYQMGQKLPNDETQLLNAKMGTDLLAEIHYDQYGVSANLKGIELLNGKEYYVIELALPDGSNSTDYYDCGTGLKYKSVESSKKGDVVAVSETVIKEYMTTKAKVQFPKVREITAEGQTYVLVTNELVTNSKLSEDIFTVK